jgi:hypothetical protein
LLSPQMAFRQKGIGHDMVPQNPNADKTILFADDDGQLPKFVAALLTLSRLSVKWSGSALR